MQENLLGLVEQAGVVGAGGAGFPTHVKLKAQADTVIINGAECEPLLRVDQQLMALQAGDLLDALDLLVEQVGASQGVVALKEHYHAAVEALERELSRHPRLRIHRMGAFYPAGDEQVIVYEVTGRVVPEGGIRPPGAACGTAAVCRRGGQQCGDGPQCAGGRPPSGPGD